jgi:hypothetical protein
MREDLFDLFFYFKRKRGEFQKLVEANEEHWTDSSKKDLLRLNHIEF